MLKRRTIFLVSSAVITTAMVAASPIAQRDAATPKPTTPVWENERDLIVVFENASDRIALAQLVMVESMSLNSDLSAQQRRDGLTIAGHTLYRERQQDLAEQCFQALLNLNYSQDDTYEAATMLGQCFGSTGRRAQAVDAYQLSDMVSRQIEAETGFHHGYRINMPLYIEAALHAGHHETALMLSDEVLSAWESYEALLYPGSDVMIAKFASRAAERLGDNDRAALYLETMLHNNPEWGTSFPGERAAAAMKVLEYKGHRLSDGDTTAISAAMDIVKSTTYQGTPIWGGYVERVSRILDDSNSVAQANELRLWATDQLKEKSLNLDASDPMTPIYNAALRRSQLQLLDRTAQMLERYHNNELAGVVYQRIIDELADVDPTRTQHAIDRLDSLAPTQAP